MRPLAVSTTSQASIQTVLKFLGEVFMAHELSVKDIGGLFQPTTLKVKGARQQANDFVESAR